MEDDDEEEEVEDDPLQDAIHGLSDRITGLVVRERKRDIEVQKLRDEITILKRLLPGDTGAEPAKTGDGLIHHALSKEEAAAEETKEGLAREVGGGA